MPEFLHTGKDKKKFVEKMFDDISPHYDILNRILSFGIDKYWRKKLIKSMNIQTGQSILDIATGTGDVIFSINKKYEVHSTGLDISKKMLDIANMKLNKNKINNISFIHGDAENLPMEDNSYDHICISFGFRNLGNYDKANKILVSSLFARLLSTISDIIFLIIIMVIYIGVKQHPHPKQHLATFYQ